MSSIRGTTSSTVPHSWVTIALLVWLAPVSVILGAFITIGNAVSRVLGHRGSLLPRSSRSAWTQKLSVQSKRRVLVTGSGPLALAFARALRRNGNYVVVTDAERVPFLNRLRYSRAVAEFVPFERGSLGNWIRWKPQSSPKFDLARHILRLIRSKKLDIWVILDSSLNHQSLLEARDLITSETNCVAFYPPRGVAILSTDLDELAHKTTTLPMAIKPPMAVHVHTRGEIHTILGGVLGIQRFLLSSATVPKENGSQSNGRRRWRDSGFSEPDLIDLMDDINDSAHQNSDGKMSYVLPLESMDATYEFLTRINISSKHPWSISEILKGRAYYANCLISDGKLKVFTVLMSQAVVTYPTKYNETDRQSVTSFQPSNLVPVDSSSAIHLSIRSFTQSFIESLPTSISSPLNFKFLLEEKSVEYGSASRLWCLSCNFDFPKFLLPWDIAVTNYAKNIAPLQYTRNKETSLELNNSPIPRIYSLPHDILQHLIIPILQFLTFRSTVTAILKSFNEFFTHLLYWKEELFDMGDPAPWLWFWIVEQPVHAAMRLLTLIVQGLRQRGLES